jgi:hypothetical protein
VEQQDDALLLASSSFLQTATKMSSLWGIILGSMLLFSLKDCSKVSSYLGFSLLPFDNTMAQSLFRISDFKLDTFIYGGFFLFFFQKV